jgi:hypothetical protein
MNLCYFVAVSHTSAELSNEERQPTNIDKEFNHDTSDDFETDTQLREAGRTLSKLPKDYSEMDSEPFELVAYKCVFDTSIAFKSVH